LEAIADDWAEAFISIALGVVDNGRANLGQTLPPPLLSETSGRQHGENPMNRHLRADYLDPFIDVARLICPVDPPGWLAEQLWRWNQWLYRDRSVEESRPSRAQMRKTLLEVEEALFVVTEALGSPLGSRVS
jgi:hypothetical protein